MKVKLGDVVKRIKNKVDKDNCDLEFYVGGEHYDTAEFLIKRFGKIDNSTIGPAFNKSFKKGDVLLMSRRPNLRKAGLVSFDGICSEVSYVLQTKNNKILMQEFLPFILQTDSFWDFADKNKKGSTNYFLNWSDFADYEFDLPSLEEQERLAKILWKIEDLKLLLDNNKLDVLNNYQLFIRETTKNYQQKKIYEIVKLYEKILAPKGTAPYLEIGDINILNKTYSIKDKPSVSGAKFVKKGNIIISLVRPTRGAIAIIKENNLAVSNAFCVLNIDDQVLNKYIYYFLLFNYDFYNYFEDKQKGSTYPTCKEEDVYNYYIPLPPSKDMVVILEKLQGFIQIHRNLDNKLQEYKNMQKQILKEAFNV